MVASQLPPWMLEMGLRFLNEIQALHDDAGNWTTEGLADEGAEAVTKILCKL